MMNISLLEALAEDFSGCCERLARCSKPVVAAVEDLGRRRALGPDGEVRDVAFAPPGAEPCPAAGPPERVVGHRRVSVRGDARREVEEKARGTVSSCSCSRATLDSPSTIPVRATLSGRRVCRRSTPGWSSPISAPTS
jgi:hypothetical protein